MARKRVLDPSIWTDDGMAELTPRQQLLYIGLISNADDEGRQKASPVAIRLCLPTVYANVLDGDIDADLTAVLKRMRQLVAYIADGRRYLVFLNYLKWQRIDRPSSSNLPAPPQPRANVRRSFDESSTIVRPELKELKEEKGIRAPDDFALFLAAYPRHDGKAMAERAWNKLAPADRERAMAALAAWKGCDQWQDVRYVPQASTYLNQRRFDDEPPPRSPSPNGHRTQADHNQSRRDAEGRLKVVL